MRLASLNECGEPIVPSDPSPPIDVLLVGRSAGLAGTHGFDQPASAPVPVVEAAEATHELITGVKRDRIKGDLP